MVQREVVDGLQPIGQIAAKSVYRIAGTGRGICAVHGLQGHDVVKHRCLRRIGHPICANPVRPGDQTLPGIGANSPVGAKIRHHRVDRTVLIA